jgi:hypothetical protein
MKAIPASWIFLKKESQGLSGGCAFQKPITGRHF